MATPELPPNGQDVSRYAVVFGLYPGDPTFYTVVERAPDVGGNPGTGVDIAWLAPGQRIFVDELGATASFHHYRFKHAGFGHQFGTPTAYYRSRVVQWSGVVPQIPREAVMDLDLVLEQADGTVDIVVNGSSIVKSVKHANSLSAYPAEDAGTAVNTDAQGDVTVGDAFTLTDGQTGFVRVTFYDAVGGAGTILGSLRSSVTYNAASGTTIPTVIEGEIIYDGAGNATLPLSFNDPDGQLMSVEAQTKSGLAAWSGWSTITAPYAITVALDEKHGSHIQYRFTHGNGVANLGSFTAADIETAPGFSHSRTGGGTDDATYTDINGITQTAADGEFRNNHYINGVRHWLPEGAATNLLLNSFAPATQSVTIPASVHTCSMKGSGSIAVSGATDGSYGTATEASPLTFTPSISQSVTFTVSGTVTHEQVETGTFPTSFISTAGSAVTRNADSLSVDHQPVPQEMTAYVKGVELGSATSQDARLLQISAGNGAAPHFTLWRGAATRYDVRIQNTTGGDGQERLAVNPSIGDTVEIIAQALSDGTPDGTYSLNGGAVTDGVAVGSPGALEGAWSAETLWIGSLGTFPTAAGFFAFESIRIATGIQSMANMRAAVTTIEARVLTLDADDIASATFQVNIDHSTGNVTVDLNGDDDAKAYRIAIDASAYQSEVTTRAATPVRVGRVQQALSLATGIAEGASRFVTIFAYNDVAGTTGESELYSALVTRHIDTQPFGLAEISGIFLSVNPTTGNVKLVVVGNENTKSIQWHDQATDYASDAAARTAVEGATTQDPDGQLHSILVESGIAEGANRFVAVLAYDAVGGEDGSGLQSVEVYRIDLGRPTDTQPADPSDILPADLPTIPFIAMSGTINFDDVGAANGQIRWDEKVSGAGLLGINANSITFAETNLDHTRTPLASTAGRVWVMFGGEDTSRFSGLADNEEKAFPAVQLLLSGQWQYWTGSVWSNFTLDDDDGLVCLAEADSTSGLSRLRMYTRNKFVLDDLADMSEAVVVVEDQSQKFDDSGRVDTDLELIGATSLHIPSTETVKVGSIATPSFISKKILVSHTLLDNPGGTSKITVTGSGGYMHYAFTTSGGVFFRHNFVVPEGCKIITVQSRLWRNDDVTSRAITTLVEVSPSEILSTKATLTHTGGSPGNWQLKSSSPSYTVPADTTWRIEAELGHNTLNTDARYQYSAIFYQMPEYQFGY